MKRTIAIATVVLLIIVYSLNAFAANISLDTSKTGDGVMGVTIHGEEGNRYKVMISKGSEEYTYDCFGTEKEYFPLQFGSGSYKVSVLQQISGTSYKVVQSKKVNVSLNVENAVFLQSIQNVNWDFDMEAIQMADDLAGSFSTVEEKVETIYEYVIQTVDYDYAKINKLDKQYVPDVESTHVSGKGICYDYSALFAAMLRSQGIPTKLVKGYSDNVDGYHAWNEVYINEEWITIDTTLDAVLGSIGEETKMEKNKNEYQALKFY